MTILNPTNDIIRVVTGSAVANMEVQTSWVDRNGSTYTPGSNEVEISTATTTTIVAAPTSPAYRKVKRISIANNHASSSNVVTVQKYNGTTSVDIMGVTLLTGESLTRDEFGNWRHLTAYGAPYEYSKPAKGILGISGAKAETFPRELCTEANTSLLTSGTLALQPIYLTAGTVVSSISVFSATTAAGTPTNQFFALYSKRWCLLAQSANDTTTAWAANTIKTLNMTSAYTVPVSDIYHIGIMVAATTVPTIKGVALAAILPAYQPILRGNSTTGLTTTLPNPCAALTTALSNAVWACVS